MIMRYHWGMSPGHVPLSRSFRRNAGNTGTTSEGAPFASNHQEREELDADAPPVSKIPSGETVSVDDLVKEATREQPIEEISSKPWEDGVDDDNASDGDDAQRAEDNDLDDIIESTYES